MIIIKKTFILVITLILLISSISYGDADKINYKNNLLIKENQDLRREVLSMRLILDKERTEEVPVLLYHHIATKEDIELYGWENNGSIVSLDNFNQQMKYLKDNNYYTATLEELELFIDGKIELPKNTIVITFDDGYLSNVEYAYPIMKNYGFKGTIFMVGETSTRDESNLSPRELLHIPSSEVYKYEDVFEFGCHTFGLHAKNEAGDPLLSSLLKDEIIEDLIKNLKLFDTKYMAYPYGSYNLNTIDYIKELGYTMAFTVDHGYVSRGSGKYELPRLVISPRTNILQFHDLINLK